jgi:hypothetical protein
LRARFRIRDVRPQPIDLAFARGEALEQGGAFGVHRQLAAFERVVDSHPQIQPEDRAARGKPNQKTQQ